MANAAADEREDEEAPPPPPAGGDGASLARNAPWWLVSVGLHVVLLLIAGLVYIERLIAVDDGTVTVTMVAAPVTAMELDRPRDVFEHKGIPKENSGEPTEEPAIFFPEAKESDHNESADGEDTHQMKGDSKEFLSYLPGDSGGFRGRQTGKGPGVYDALGVGGGGGGGGRYGGRLGGRENLVARGGGTKATESAVLAALRWLARHQSDDGHWSCAGFSDRCKGGKCGGPGEAVHDAGVTGLSLLAFLGAGYTHLSRDTVDGVNFGTLVKKAEQWLVTNQSPEGLLGPKTGHYMYNHAIAALALSEAYGMTSAPMLKEPAQKAIDYLAHAQNPYKAWRYSERCGDNDTSVTGWVVMAFKSADISGLRVPRTGYEGARAWLNEMDTKDYKFAYALNGKGKPHFVTHLPAMTSVGMLCSIFIDKNRMDPRLAGGAAHIVKQLPEWKGNDIDYYYWYYASLALFQFDGPSGRYWKSWNERMKDVVVTHQRVRKDGCADGSWDTDERWCKAGGRVYATAINALTLEVYYRYENVFGVH